MRSGLPRVIWGAARRYLFPRGTGSTSHLASTGC